MGSPARGLRRLALELCAASACTCTPHARVSRAAASPNRHHLQHLQHVLLSSFDSPACMCRHAVECRQRTSITGRFSPLLSSHLYTTRQTSRASATVTYSSPYSLDPLLRITYSPVEFPRIPALSQKRLWLDIHRLLFPAQNPKSVVAPATAGKKIVSSISQPQSCASQLRRFASRPSSSLASTSALPTLFPPTRLSSNEKQKGKPPAPNFATG